MNYWERWIGDWKRKTAHLTAEAKGIYGELLDHAYATQRPLPLEPEYLYRIAGAVSASERKATDHIVAEFFERGDDGYTNRRVQEEISKRMNYVKQQQDKANRRWHPEPQAHEPINGKSVKPHHPLDTGDIIERIPMIGGEEFEVRQSFVAELERLYPAVDIAATLRQMRGWCIGNPAKLKTPRGIRKFITGWCERDQNGSPRR